MHNRVPVPAPRTIQTQAKGAQRRGGVWYQPWCVPLTDGPATSDNEHMLIERARKRLRKKAKRGLRGYPVATIALYGPNDTRATKLTVGIVPAEDAEVADLRRWFSEGADIRNDAGVAQEVLTFIDAAGAKSVVMTDRIIGCPHEEGIDYEGPTCPACPFWAGRDRWTGKRLH